MVVLRGPAQLRRTRRPARAVTPNEEVTDAAVPATLSPDGRRAGAMLAVALGIVMLYQLADHPTPGREGTRRPRT